MTKASSGKLHRWQYTVKTKKCTKVMRYEERQIYWVMGRFGGFKLARSPTSF